MALPDLEDLLLERFRVFHLNVEGITTASKTPQADTLDKYDLPHMTHLVGASGTIPTSGDGNTPAHLLIPRTIVGRLLIHPLGTGEDVDQQGALANVLALPFFSILRIAHLRSPRLGLAGYEEFPYLDQDIRFRDSGLVTRPGPGGATYAAIDWTFDCVLKFDAPEPDDDDDIETAALGLYDQFGLS